MSHGGQKVGKRSQPGPISSVAGGCTGLNTPQRVRRRFYSHHSIIMKPSAYNGNALCHCMRIFRAYFRLGTHYLVHGLYSWVANTAREHGCHFRHPCSRSVWLTLTTSCVLQVENNYDVIINNGPSRQPVFTVVQNF